MIVFVFLPSLRMSGHLYIRLVCIYSPRNHTHSCSSQSTHDHHRHWISAVKNHHVENAKHRLSDKTFGYPLVAECWRDSVELTRVRMIYFSRKPHRAVGRRFWMTRNCEWGCHAQASPSKRTKSSRESPTTKRPAFEVLINSFCLIFFNFQGFAPFIF